MASANPPPPPPSPKHASLFVRNLHPSVTESQLFTLFSPNVVSTLVCRDRVTGASLCYGFVDFADPHQASNAMELLNFTQVNGKPIKIAFSHRDPSTRRSEYAKVFVNNLDTSIDDNRLLDIFAAFGTVLHCHVATDSNGQSEGYGFVHFEHDASAQDALQSLNGVQINDRQLYVRLSVHSKEKNQTKVSHKLTNLYVKNFSVTTTDEDLKKVFSNFGIITSADVVRDANGNSRGFGFVSFQNPDAAAVAVEKVNRTTPIDDNVWYVAKAVRQGESEFWQRSISEPEKNKNMENLLVGDFHCKNFEQSSRDESLKGLYSDFGNAASCKLKQDSQGQRRSSAFVTFSSSAEVNRAARSEIRAPVIVGPPLSVMPGYHTLGPSFAPQLPSFGQAANGFPWQPAHTLQQQQLPAIWSGFTSNFVVPLRAPQARSEIRVPVIVGLPPSVMPRYHTLGPNFAPQLSSFVQAAYGFPRQPADTLQQQQLPAVSSGVISNFVAPLRASPQLVHYSANQGYMYMSSGWNVASPALVPQASMCPMAPMSFNVTGMPMPLMDIQQLGPVPFSTPPPALVPNNSNQGFMYMRNVWNVVSPPLVPPDLISPEVAMPHGVSRMHVPPIYVPRPAPFSMLPFASPELQRLMSGQGPFPVFECMEHDHVGELKGSPRVVFFSGKTISIVFAEWKRRNSEKNRTVVLNHQCFTTCRHIIHQLSPCKKIHFRSGINAKQSVLCLSSSSRETDSSRSTCPQDLPLIATPSKDGKIEVCKQGTSKTEMCNKWEKTGTCPYGNQCLFAHGVHELRPVVRHSLYKTQICRMISAGGTCHYSHRCHFRHSLDPIVEGEVVL